jgi:prephenate dehydratase
MTRPTAPRQPKATPSKSPRAGGGIAFQGLPGAYSHLACREAYPGLTALPCATFEDAFAAVTDNKAALAMIPIENSVAGRVADIHHLLPDSGLYIVAEHYQRVRHQLLAPKGAKLERLKRVFSHPQALAQCRKTLRNLKLEAVSRADTAGAAAEVAERNDPTEAAIASSLAGEIYGLDTVRSHLEDAIDNTTRFIVMSRHRADPDPKAGPAITSFVFQVRSVPAALYKSLGGFATNGVNVVKLESYIVDASFSVAQFYAEIEGHVADRAVDRAFDELKFYASKFKILGVFPAHSFRREA